jgi:hypothetical protein
MRRINRRGRQLRPQLQGLEGRKLLSTSTVNQASLLPPAGGPLGPAIIAIRTSTIDVSATTPRHALVDDPNI